MAWLTALPLWISDVGISDLAFVAVSPGTMLTPTIATALTTLVFRPSDGIARSTGLVVPKPRRRLWKFSAIGLGYPVVVAVLALPIGIVTSTMHLDLVDLVDLSGLRALGATWFGLDGTSDTSTVLVTSIAVVTGAFVVGLVPGSPGSCWAGWTSAPVRCGPPSSHTARTIPSRSSSPRDSSSTRDPGGSGTRPDPVGADDRVARSRVAAQGPAGRRRGHVRRLIGAVRPPGRPVAVMLARENCRMVIPTEPTGERSRHPVPAAAALLCLAVVLLDAAADVLPDDPVAWVATPLRIVVAVGLLAAVVALGSPLRLWTVLDAAVAALVLAAAIATVTAGQDWSGWRAVVTAVAVYQLAVAVRRTSFGSPGVMGLLALTAVALASITAIRQGLAGTATGFCRGAANATADVCGADAMIRVTGTFSNPNLLAAFLVLLLPLAAVGSAAPSERAARVLGTGVVVLGYAAVLLTASRGGVLGALAGAGAFVVLRRPTARRIAAALLGLSVVVTALLIAANGSAGVRADVWGEALKLIAAHPLGVGPGRAGELLAAAVPGDEQFQHAHNLWLNWAVETGYLGLVGALGLTVGAGLITVYATRRGAGIVAAALGAGLAGFAVVSLADHPANANRLSLAMWVVLGLLAGLLATGRGAGSDSEQDEPDDRTTPIPVTASAGSPRP